MEITKNTGLKLEDVLGAKDWVLGGINDLQQHIVRPDGQWGAFLPELEKQTNGLYDVYSCVSFANLNVVETYVKARYNIDLNLSDRFLAASSFTKCGWGNYLGRVADTLRTQGGVDEAEYPWEGETCELYMVMPPDNIKEKAKKLLDEWEVKWAWSYNNSLSDQEETKEALKYSPISVAIAFDYSTIKDDIFQRTEKKSYHCVMVYGYVENEYWLMFDHYDWSIKKLAWDYKFDAKLSTQLIKKVTKPPMTDVKKILIDKGMDKGTFLVQQTGSGATGEFGVLIDSKLYIDSLDKLLATFLVREGKPGGGLTPEVWNNLIKVDLKNKPIK